MRDHDVSSLSWTGVDRARAGVLAEDLGLFGTMSATGWWPLYKPVTLDSARGEQPVPERNGYPDAGIGRPARRRRAVSASAV
jgi:hypothetical protein